MLSTERLATECGIVANSTVALWSYFECFATWELINNICVRMSIDFGAESAFTASIAAYLAASKSKLNIWTHIAPGSHIHQMLLQ